VPARLLLLLREAGRILFAALLYLLLFFLIYIVVSYLDTALIYVYTCFCGIMDYPLSIK
jgi:hypothetical protein